MMCIVIAFIVALFAALWNADTQGLLSAYTPFCTVPV